MSLKLFTLLTLISYFSNAQQHNAEVIFDKIIQSQNYKDDDLDSYVTYRFMKNYAEQKINSVIALKNEYEYHIIENSGIVNGSASLKVTFLPKKDKNAIKQYFFLFKTEDKSLLLDAIECYTTQKGDEFVNDIEKALNIVQNNEPINIRDKEKKEIDYYSPKAVPSMYKQGNDYTILQKNNGNTYLEILFNLNDIIYRNEKYSLNSKHYAHTLKKMKTSKNQIAYIKQILHNYKITTNENIDKTVGKLQKVRNLIQASKTKLNNPHNANMWSAENKETHYQLEKSISKDLDIHYYSLDYSFNLPHITPYFQINTSLQNSCGKLYYKGFLYDVEGNKKPSINYTNFYFLKDLGNHWYYFEMVD